MFVVTFGFAVAVAVMNHFNNIYYIIGLLLIFHRRVFYYYHYFSLFSFVVKVVVAVVADSFHFIFTTVYQFYLIAPIAFVKVSLFSFNLLYDINFSLRKNKCLVSLSFCMYVCSHHATVPSTQELKSMNKMHKQTNNKSTIKSN